MLDSLRQDLKYAVRHLQRSPGFAATALLTLALGIGANSGMFTILNAIVLRPLAIGDPDGLVGVSGRGPQGELRLTLIPAINYLADGPLHPVCGYNGGVVLSVEAGGTPTQAIGAFMTSECHSVFGVMPMLGRPLVAEDTPIDVPGSHRVALISHAFWLRLFGADPGAVGKTIRTEGVEIQIVGVMPPGFGGLHADFAADIFAPFDAIFPAPEGRRPGASHILGRLRPGARLEQAAAELEARWPTLLEAVVPATVGPVQRQSLLRARPRVERIGTGTSFFRDQYARPLTLIVGLTGILLFLTCINLGGLLLSRLAARSSDLSIRRALGASRWRIGRQMLIESLLLAAGGALLALPVAYGVVSALASFLPSGLVSRTVSFTPDTTVLTVTTLVALSAAVVMGTLPIWIASRGEKHMASTWARTIAGATSRTASALLVLQVALSVVLLVGASLLVRSLYLLQQVDLGVRSEDVLSVKVMPVPSGYSGIDNASHYPSLEERLLSVSGVRSVGMSRMFPSLFTDWEGAPTSLLGQPDGDVPAVRESASPAFFATLGIPLLQGRVFSWTDDAASQQVAVVSASLAARLAENGDVIGRRLKHGSIAADQDLVIVGVVGNATLGNPRQADISVLYRPTLQTGRFANNPNLLIKVSGDRAAVAGRVRQVIAESGREYVHSIDSLDRVLASAPASERMSATLAVVMSAIAVALAVIGLYGLLAYAVVRRTREIGVRLAVGASPAGVVRMVLREGIGLTLAGLAIGLPAALLAARVLRTLMFGITETDPLTLVVTVVVFACVGFGAGFIPARRAASVDPVVALRSE